jgi:hypothetical protein
MHEVGRAERHRRLDEQALRGGELRRVRLVCLDQGDHGGPRDLPFGERPSGRGHALERSRRADSLSRARAGHPETVAHPSHGRYIAVAAKRATHVDLGQPSQPLGRQAIRGSLELEVVSLELLFAEEPEVFSLELIEGRSQRAHGVETGEHVFGLP